MYSNVTIGDAWARYALCTSIRLQYSMRCRALSYHFLTGTNLSNFFDTSSHGAGQLWSQIASASFFANHQAPFPLVVLDSNGTFDLTTESIPLDSPVYEVQSHMHTMIYNDSTAPLDFLRHTGLALRIYLIRSRHLSCGRAVIHWHIIVRRCPSRQCFMCYRLRPSRFRDWYQFQYLCGELRAITCEDLLVESVVVNAVRG